jgi:hypothetical protein
MVLMFIVLYVKSTSSRLFTYCYVRILIRLSATCKANPRPLDAHIDLDSNRIPIMLIR